MTQDKEVTDCLSTLNQMADSLLGYYNVVGQLEDKTAFPCERTSLAQLKSKTVLPECPRSRSAFAEESRLSFSQSICKQERYFVSIDP